MLARRDPGGRPQPRVRQRPARDRERARGAGVAGSSTCTGSTRTSRCSRPWSSARCSTARVVQRAAAARRRVPRRAPRGASHRRRARRAGRRRTGACAREIDLLRYQLAEIDAAEITGAHEAEALTAEPTSSPTRKRTARRSPPRTRRSKARPRTPWVGPRASSPGRAPFSAIADRLHALQAEIAEAAREVRIALESVVVDPERLAGVQARRALLQELTRKYGPGLAEVLEYRTEIATPARGARDPRRPGGRARRRRGRPRSPAPGGPPRDLTALRKRRPGRSRRRSPSSSGTSPCPRRRSRSSSPRPSSRTTAPTTSRSCWRRIRASRPAPLARAASGGELSRAMLALRVVLSEAPPTLVFDEVDAGIGGEAGSAVGRALAGLGGHHQVLCVTHLPQVAAFADAHVAVVEVGAARPDPRPGRRCCSTTRGSRSSRGCSPASSTRRTPASTRASWSSARRVRCGPRRAPGEAAPARRQSSHEVVQGIARVDRRTKDLAKRIGQGRDRDHRPPRHRPRRGRVARRRGRRRGREREPVDLRPLSERRPDPDRARRASRCSTRSATT